MEVYHKYIKPHSCAILVTGIGVYFLTPMLAPSVSGGLQSLPVLGGFVSLRGTEALLAGIYAASSVAVCEKTGLVKYL